MAKSATKAATTATPKATTKTAAAARGPAGTRGRLPPFVLDRYVFFLFGQILGRRARDVERALAPLGVTAPQWRVLAALHSRPGVSLTQLGDLTAVDRTAAMRTVEMLRKGGLVDRLVDPHNRRSVLLTLTAAGEALFASAYSVMHEIDRSALRGIDEAELELLVAQLHRITANLAGAARPAR